MFKIPFNKPTLQGKEFKYIEESIRSWHISGDGLFTKKCQNFLENELKVFKAFLTTSCTDALEMASILLNVKAGDEIIVPSFTFVSTINAFVLRGAQPVFVDIRNDTMNLDEKLIEQAITPKTKIIILVHYAGVGCQMDAIQEIAFTKGIKIVEDNAHGLFAKYKGKNLGTFGSVATQSFHETKNFSCGEGGALLINDETLAPRAEIIREKGTNRSRFFRGQVDKYSWVDVGSSFLPSDMLAAYLYAQFEMMDKIQSQRKLIWNKYFSELKVWESLNGFKLPFVPPHCEQAYHMFYLIAPTLEMRTQFINYLKENGITAAFHYQSLHLSEMGKKLQKFKSTQCPITEKMSDCLVRLPFYNNLTEEEQNYIIEKVMDFKI